MPPDGMNEPGTYQVTVDGEKTSLEADRLDYAADGSLQAWRGDNVIATFRWWSAVVKTK